MEGKKKKHVTFSQEVGQTRPKKRKTTTPKRRIS
jgi:hypothetical protein